MANPIASGGPAALDVRRAPGIRTAAGRGYRPRGRPVLSLESRERAAGTMPAACPTHPEIQSDPIQEALPPARGPDAPGPGLTGKARPSPPQRQPAPAGSFPHPQPLHQRHRGKRRPPGRQRPARCRPRVQPIGRSKVIQSKKRALQLVARTPLALACMARSAHAANRVNLHQQDVSGINSRYANASVAIGVSKQASVRHAEMLGLGPDSTLSVLRTGTTRDGVRNTRYQQQFRGVPVYGEHVVVSEDANGQVRALFGRKIEGLAAELPAVAPRVSSTQALASAKRAALGSRLLGMRVQAEKSRQVVFVGDDGRAHMAWQVSFFADSAGGGSPTSPLVIVDAASGAILKQFDALKNVEIGTGPGGNEKTGQYEYGTDYGFLDVEENGADCTMNSEKVTTINLDHGTSGSTPWTYTCPRNTVEAINGAYAPLNDAHYFGHVVFDMYNDYLQTSPLTNKVTLKVHYSTNYENAFWEPATQTMYFGDGASTFYPLVGLDVLAHEVSHGYTEQNSNLEYAYQPGGINEAFSDMAGEAAEFFFKGENDFLIGGEIFKAPGEALRYMEDPTLAGISTGSTND